MHYRLQIVFLYSTKPISCHPLIDWMIISRHGFMLSKPALPMKIYATHSYFNPFIVCTVTIFNSYYMCILHIFHSLRQVGEHRDKALKELREQLASKQGAPVGIEKQNFWETSCFKVVVSMSMLILVVFSKRWNIA